MYHIHTLGSLSAKSLLVYYFAYCSLEINVSAGVTQLKLHQETKKF